MLVVTKIILIIEAWHEYLLGVVVTFSGDSTFISMLVNASSMLVVTNLF